MVISLRILFPYNHIVAALSLASVPAMILTLAVAAVHEEVQQRA
jgi:hypothetical protein